MENVDGAWKHFELTTPAPVLLETEFISAL